MLIFKLFFLLFAINNYEAQTEAFNRIFKTKVCCSVVDECFGHEGPSYIPLPDCPKDEFKINYYLFRRGKNDSISFNIDTVPKSEFEEGGKIIFLIHGWKNTVDRKMMLIIKNELLQKEDSKIIFVDWKRLGSRNLYPLSLSNTRPTGAHIAKVLKKIKAASKEKIYTWCVGYSLGAHVCGQVGRKILLERITGLDPAGPFYRSKKMHKLILNKESADFVDIIHTSNFFGHFEPLGHADFYLNGGKVQPTCSIFQVQCSHKYSLQYWIASINNPCFKATFCFDFKDFVFSCLKRTESVLMGYDASPKNTGIYYLETGAVYPFCERS